MHFRAYILLRFKHAVLGPHTSAIWVSVLDSELDVLLVVNAREERVVALHLLICSLKTYSGYEPRYEP